MISLQCYIAILQYSFNTNSHKQNKPDPFYELSWPSWNISMATNFSKNKLSTSHTPLFPHTSQIEQSTLESKT